ncbi:predicted protein [Naegleria gruberi]|uniref:Predicted protein n=1 Tax=Naegleria gruberi TaxID=5762 RepID=D2VHU5_NAEGR|nr:uncharacterized protein NAEGRDRAFT_80020 [Naegleria gruberi]EFC43737.1 predicted protein [Naegleria gruberi]|eukprot:XP_002676481.1 predicted protein [Naegleria gruberi strain NEG-M]
MASTISNLSSPASSPSSTTSTSSNSNIVTTPRKHLTPLSTPTNNNVSITTIITPPIKTNDNHVTTQVASTNSLTLEKQNTNLLSTNNGIHKATHKSSSNNNSKQIVITQQVLNHPIQKSNRLNRQSEYLHSIGDHGKAAQLNRKGMSILERSKNLTCDKSALDSINHLISHYKSEYRFQRNLDEATTITNNMNGSTILNNRSRINNGPIVMEQYGDREMIMPKQYDLSESMIGLSATQSTNNHNLLTMNDFNGQCLSPIGHNGGDTPSQSTPTTPGVTLYSELYNLFIYPWIQYQKNLEEATENEQLRKLFNKTLLSTQQKLNQVMQKTQSADETDMANSQFGSMSGMSSPLHPMASSTAMHTDISKKLLSLSYSLNADKVTRLTNSVSKKDKEIELLKKKIKEQQEIISKHEENWKLMKQEAMESAMNKANK